MEFSLCSCIALLTSVSIFFLFFGCTVWHMGSWSPNQGSNLCPLQWKRRIFTTRPPGKSSEHIYDCYFELILGKSLTSVSLRSVSRDLSFFFVWNISRFFIFLYSLLVFVHQINSYLFHSCQSGFLYDMNFINQLSSSSWLPFKPLWLFKASSLFSVTSSSLGCAKSHQFPKGEDRSQHLDLLAVPQATAYWKSMQSNPLQG